MSRRLRRPPARLSALAAAGGLLLSLATMTATAAPTDDPSPAPPDDGGGRLVTFGISTATGALPDDRASLEMTAGPGSTIYENVAVINQSNVPLDLDLYAEDAFNTATGDLALPARDAVPTDAGSWITVGASRVTVAPQSSTTGIGFVVVPVTITIPTDAEPGDHVAGILTSLTAGAATSGGDTSAELDFEQRVGVRVYVTVDGELHPGLRVSGVRATYHPASTYGLAGPGSATVTYTLTNTGNVRLTVEPTATASGLFGLGEASAAGDPIEDLLPKASVTQTVELPSVWPMVLDHVEVQAKVSLPSDGSDAGIGTPSDSVWMWAVPWAYLAIILLLAAGWWWRRRRKAKRPGGRRVRERGAPKEPAPIVEGAKEQLQTVP